MEKNPGWSIPPDPGPGEKNNIPHNFFFAFIISQILYYTKYNKINLHSSIFPGFS